MDSLFKKSLENRPFILIAGISFIFLLIYQVSENSITRSLVQRFMLPLSPVSSLYAPWTYFTALFVHIHFFHWLGNMLILYLWYHLMQTLGEEKKFFTYFLAGGILSFVFTQGIFFFLSHEEKGFLAGCSSSVFFIGGYYTSRIPNFSLSLFLLPSLPLKYFFPLIFLLSSLTSGNDNMPGLVVHITAAFSGMIWWGIKKQDFFKEFFSSSVKKKNRKVKEKIPHPDYEKEKKLNALLDKILEVGYENLSEKEKKELEQLSRKK